LAFDFVLLFGLDDFFGFARRAGLRLVDEALALAFAVLPLFFAVRLELLPRFFAVVLLLLLLLLDGEGFALRRFAPPLFATALALTATFLTAFLAAGAAELEEAAARPAIAPSRPPTTAPTGPATLPRTAPAAAPTVCFEIGGISMFSDDEPEVSGDGVDG